MIHKLWIEVRSSLWFVPGLLVLASVVMALVLVEIDVAFAQSLASKSWQPLLNTGAEGARGMLTAIASSMITVAGVAFSITIVSLSLASTQYTPRILRNFMRDRANQGVLGVFLAIFTYCLIVLRTIRGGAERDGAGFVPLLSVAFGMLLALLSIGCLIFFIHHIASSIQASSILRAIMQETAMVIDRFYPEKEKQQEEEKIGGTQEAFATKLEWQAVASSASGYIQHVDSEAILSTARTHRLTPRLERLPGEFIVEGSTLISVDKVMEPDAAAGFRACFVIGDFRTIDQDPGFGIRQIVDIALKALSPGVNDTSTAVACLDYLSAILARLQNRRLASPFSQQKDGIRMLAPAPSFAQFVSLSFDEIRLASAGNVTVHLQMLRVVGQILLQAQKPERMDALLQAARLVIEQADATVRGTYDRDRINQQIEQIRLVPGANILPGLS
jgi:uncharacterized membrane protein